MSKVDYNNLLFEISESLDELNLRERLLFLCRGKLASGREDSIQDALALFKVLEECNHLGPNRLGLIKNLLKGVKEWGLLGKVKKFESKRREYLDLLEQIIPALDELNDLERLISICRVEIPDANEGNIPNVRSLFKELENNSCLGIDCLDILKEILTQTERNGLLKEVDKFEERRNREDEFETRKAQATAFVSSVGAQSFGIISSLKRAAGRAVNLVCNFRTLAGGLLVVGGGLVLRSCSSFGEYSDAFNKVVLPASSKLMELREGSLCFTVQAETASVLSELWSSYNDGTLKNRLQEFLVTEEVKQLASGEHVEVTVFIDEEEYKEAYLNLMLLQNQLNDLAEQERPDDRPRRTSDSFLHLSPKEDEVTLMRLKQAENKWNFKVQLLEKENEELKLAAVKEREDLGFEMEWKRPVWMRRTHSDSSLYQKTTHKEIRESEIKQGRYLDDEKYALVLRYLESSRSAVTKTSKSGVNSEGTPSELGSLGSASETSDSGVYVKSEGTPSDLSELGMVDSSGKEEKLPDSFDKSIVLLLSPHHGPEDIVLQLKDFVRIDQFSWGQPAPGTKELIRYLAMKAKKLDRLDVVHHLREITPPGTTGPLLPGDLEIRNIPLRQMRELTVTLSGGDEWMLVAARLGLTGREIRFLDGRTLNPFDAVLSFISARSHISVGDLYDILNECGLPVMADLL